ncbi:MULTISPECIES: STAS domain-containing protein [Gammaproteobacteria]|uniref:STAS domain-containing protein n=1 Tax=Gammaproteobacteria TaxID=1236 RepID=UPI000DCFD192|nr:MULTISPECIES: STAS domain-containing protein [Gammaproteobacteria]RTE87539.1 anti-sigma factor antagonist [Aliidiomarina sp. B3213]TCZ92676.1 anti-sigma factor antagonist [Lysobacter sp. N42]
MNLFTEYSSDRKQFTIRVKGKFDFSMVQEFRQAYSEIGNEPVNIVIDFRETEYIDSAALGMLLNMRKALGTSAKSIQLINCRSEIRNILDISRFDKLFQID